LNTKILGRNTNKKATESNDDKTTLVSWSKTGKRACRDLFDISTSDLSQPMGLRRRGVQKQTRKIRSSIHTASQVQNNS
jgi:hypothetical protein